MKTAYVALGSNLGDREATLKAALQNLDCADCKVRRVSQFLETEPVGGPPGQPKFLNAAAELSTALSARQLLDKLLQIEAQLGRVRDSGERNAPRTIDLDLLLYEEEVVNEPGLIVPHPRMHERRFVLEPLAEIAPSAVHPFSRRTIRDLLQPITSEGHQSSPDTSSTRTPGS